METLTELSIGEIVAKDYRKAEVFKKYGIDFCCGGKESLTNVCREKGIIREQIEKELILAETSDKLPSQDFSSWNIGFLADYIVNTHHKYVLQSMPVIFEFTQKVAQIHGHEHPETIEVAKLFMNVMNELNRHMMKEENILFPYIKQLSEIKISGCHVSFPPPFGTVQNPINMMEHEHDEVGEMMHEIKRITTNYSLPASACNSYRYSYSKLNEFDEDLHQHIHLENNILFPKTIELEKELSV